MHIKDELDLKIRQIVKFVSKRKKSTEKGFIYLFISEEIYVNIEKISIFLSFFYVRSTIHT